MAANWEERRLCDDGGCTGLIGNDGLCRVCGRASKFWGDERRRGMQDEDEDAGDGGARSAGESAGGADDDEDARALCPDGSCTGLLDVDGRCKICGKVDESHAGRTRSRVAVGAAAATTATAHRDDGDEGDDGANDHRTGGGRRGSGGGDDGDERQLCPDGACTGLIGSDGACKVCGRRAEA